jgi:hypothetical protein
LAILKLCVLSVQDAPPAAVVQVNACDTPPSLKVTCSVAEAPKAALMLTLRFEMVWATGDATSATDSVALVKPPPTGGAYWVVVLMKVRGVPDHPDVPPPESEPQADPASTNVNTLLAFES